MSVPLLVFVLVHVCNSLYKVEKCFVWDLYIGLPTTPSEENILGGVTYGFCTVLFFWSVCTCFVNLRGFDIRFIAGFGNDDTKGIGYNGRIKNCDA